MRSDQPVVRRLVDAGERRLGAAVQRLLESERFVLAVQAVVTGALRARSTVDAGLNSVLATMNVPSTSDLDALKDKLEELERGVGRLEAALEPPRSPGGE